MNLQQLRYIHEITRHRMNISAAAKALHTSQPGISKQLKLLEAEVGAQIFVRSRNKVVALTPFGESIRPVVSRIVADVAHIKAAATDLRRMDSGTLTLATTHTQAHYVLPEIMKRFVKRHPKVRLIQRLGTPSLIADLVASGEVDVGITTSLSTVPKSLISLPCRKLERVVVVAADHELLTKRSITLRSVAQYPFVAYNTAFTGHQDVLKAFRLESLEPNIVLGASDVDVIKACVEKGFGISVLLEVAYDPLRDTKLRAIPAGHLFPPAVVSIVLQRQHFFSNYCYDFIELLDSRWRRTTVENAISGHSTTFP